MKRFGHIVGGVILVTGLAVGLAAFLPQRQAVQDFIVLYSANLGVVNRVPIYDAPAISRLVMTRLSLSPDFSLYPYPYPPWMALSTFYLGLLPVYWAANAWTLLNIAMLVASALLLSSDWKLLPRIILCMAALLFIPALGLVVVGQYSAPVLLGAALFAYAARHKEAALAALGLLLVTFKPHIGLLLFPAGFLWLVFQKTAFGRRAAWFSLGGGVILSALAFIADPAWPWAYPQALLGYTALPGVAGRDLSASLPVMLVKLLTGQPNPFWIDALSLLLILVFLLLFWRFGLFANIEALCAGLTLLTLLAGPYLFNYDYVLLLLPLIYLAGKAGGPGARLALAGTYLLPWISLLLSRDANIFYAFSALLLVWILLRTNSLIPIDGSLGNHYT